MKKTCDIVPWYDDASFFLCKHLRDIKQIITWLGGLRMKAVKSTLITVLIAIVFMVWMMLPQPVMAAEVVFLLIMNLFIGIDLTNRNVCAAKYFS